MHCAWLTSNWRRFLLRVKGKELYKYPILLVGGRKYWTLQNCMLVTLSNVSTEAVNHRRMLLCARADGAEQDIAKNDWSAATGKLSGFQGLHCDSASASDTSGQDNRVQSDTQLASAQDSAALVQEGNIMKRLDWG